MPDITMPDGQVVRFPDTMSQTQISGLIARKYPREVGEANAAVPGAERNASGGFAFDGTRVPGYDPKTGIVAGSSIDDNAADEYGIGLRRGAEAAVGAFGDVGQTAGNLAGWLAGKAGAGPETQQTVGTAASYLSPFPFAPTTEDIRSTVTDPLAGRPDEALTRTGQAARTAGEFGAGALAPGGAARKAAMVAMPAAGSEIGAYLAEDTPYEAYARLAGGLLGGGLAAIKPSARPISDAARGLGTKTKDLTRIIKRMQQDGFSPDDINARLAELGPDATLMDVGPNLRQEGQRIYAKGGRGRGLIDEVLTPRDQGANARIRGAIDANLGPSPIPSRVDDAIIANQRALDPAYQDVFQGARRVDTANIANDMESAAVNLRGRAQQAVERVRGMLNIRGTTELDPHPRTLFETRKAIDGLLGTETDGNAIRALSAARRQVDDELARAVPGLKDVDARFSELARQREGLGRGQQVLDSGRTAPRPQELADEFQQGSLPQGRQVGPSAAPMRLRQGARAEIDRIVGTNANDRVALQRLIKGEGDWNRDRLATLFGQDRAARMFSVLDRERTFADTSNRIMKNSATAERLPEGGGSSGVREAFMAGGPKSLAYSGLVRGVEAAVDKIRGAAAASRDERVARILSSTDANRIATAILRANGGRPIAADQIDNAVRTLLLTSGATANDR